MEPKLVSSTLDGRRTYLAPPCRFPAVYNFGDSNSDTGAAFGPIPPPYPTAALSSIICIWEWLIWVWRRCEFWWWRKKQTIFENGISLDIQFDQFKSRCMHAWDHLIINSHQGRAAPRFPGLRGCLLRQIPFDHPLWYVSIHFFEKLMPWRFLLRIYSLPPFSFFFFNLCLLLYQTLNLANQYNNKRQI